jgi:hypothetical protein
VTKIETELNNFLVTAAAEAEAQAWNVENAERRSNFVTRRLAALAIEDTDPFADDTFDELAA